MLWDIPEFLLKKHCPAVLLSHVNSAVLFPCRHGNGCESGGVQPSRLGTGALEEANMPPSSRRGLKKGKLVPRSVLIHICCSSNVLHLARLSLEAVLGRQWCFVVSVSYSGSFKGIFGFIYCQWIMQQSIRFFPLLGNRGHFLRLSISNSSTSGKGLILENICIGWRSKTNCSEPPMLERERFNKTSNQRLNWTAKRSLSLSRIIRGLNEAQTRKIAVSFISASK